ncbi:putative short-subunit dehydrogenase-like oxidoreductase (DUF2520 family) [Anaerosolibacter carboniphilus]|uniref:Putative short-subunit dehydrogenase-like oxidoreductase (DUF2520 family) n=1 Tax=Anaerosolibacter carboniphilus TaxID=1417629 RepID=A0A841KKQ2_9FIRM|nr:DUF2520 domain-containing protein [Anaerosolibacter carboniphilus]MBB6214017.1 putative short-subunit dehydrogenase-like oxidoreductase (DUF2520 family) [Anaerosolibacter carboniphilus]
MKFGFIGAGKVGIAFGMYLRKKGFSIQGYFSRNHISAQIAAEKTNSQAYKKVEQLISEIDFLWITTPDDEIQAVCNHLAERKLFREGQIVAHMSGAAPSILLKEAQKRGCHIYSIHPLQSFAEIEKALKDLESTYFSIEGDLEKMHLIEALFKKLGNPIFKIATKYKALYHAAACVFSNYLVTLVDEGLHYLERIGIDQEEGFKAVLPLMMGTLHNIEAMGTAKALTGPIARGDQLTIESHIRILENQMSESVAFYKRMGQMTLDVASVEKLKDKEKIAALEYILKEV